MWTKHTIWFHVIEICFSSFMCLLNAVICILFLFQFCNHSNRYICVIRETLYENFKSNFNVNYVRLNISLSLWIIYMSVFNLVVNFYCCQSFSFHLWILEDSSLFSLIRKYENFRTVSKIGSDFTLAQISIETAISFNFNLNFRMA